MNRSVIKRFFALGLLGFLVSISLQAQADVTFTFEEVNGTVVMISSGVLDTSKLVSVDLPDGWGGTGTENNSTPGDIDIMGGTSFGDVDTQFGFSPGTDASAITSPGGPFAESNFTVETIEGSRSFTTYSGFDESLRLPGIGVIGADMVGEFWTTDQIWTYPSGSTLTSLGLRTGIYAVSDMETGETITIKIGTIKSVPTLNNIVLILLAAAVLLMGGLALRRKNTA